MKNKILNKLERILLDGKNVFLAGAGAIILTVTGCSAIKTNTLPMNQEPFANSTMQGTKIDEINTNQGKYLAIKIPEDKTVTLNDSLFSKNTILDFYLIPYNNSEEIRNDKELRINSDEKYALINIEFNSQRNEPQLNRDSYRKQTKMILEEKTSNALEDLEVNSNELISERKIPKISQKLGMVRINNQLYSFIICDENVKDSENPRYYEKRLGFSLITNNYAPFKKTIRKNGTITEELGLKNCYQYAPIKIDDLIDIPQEPIIADSTATQNSLPTAIRTAQ